MKYYKLWVYIEECDEEKERYVDVSEPISIGEFKNKKSAFEFAEQLFSNRPIV